MHLRPECLSHVNGSLGVCKVCAHNSREMTNSTRTKIINSRSLSQVLYAFKTQMIDNLTAD
jgi:hypothetical protein